MAYSLRRRDLLTAGSAFVVAGITSRLAAQEALRIGWADLVPREGGISFDDLRAERQLDMGQNQTGYLQTAASGFTDAYDGQIVSLPGFMVPLDHVGFQVRQFILVPVAGACIHTPPPPANQMVFTTLSAPADFLGLYEAVEITGTLSTIAMSTVVGDIGYAMADASVRRWIG